MQLDDTLVALVECLLGVWHRVRAEQQNADDIRRRFQAKYLLQVFRKLEFNVAAFQANPQTYKANISKARVALSGAIDAIGFVRTDRKTLAEELGKFHEFVNQVDLGFSRAC